MTPKRPEIDGGCSAGCLCSLQAGCLSKLESLQRCAQSSLRYSMASRHLDCAPALSNLSCEQQAYCPTLLRPPIRVRPSRAAISAAAAASLERTTRRSTSLARLVANSPVPRPLMTSVRESCKFDQPSIWYSLCIAVCPARARRTLWALGAYRYVVSCCGVPL